MISSKIFLGILILLISFLIYVIHPGDIFTISMGGLSLIIIITGLFESRKFGKKIYILATGIVVAGMLITNTIFYPFDSENLLLYSGAIILFIFFLGVMVFNSLKRVENSI